MSHSWGTDCMDHHFGKSSKQYVCRVDYKPLKNKALINLRLTPCMYPSFHPIMDISVLKREKLSHS